MSHSADLARVATVIRRLSGETAAEATKIDLGLIAFLAKRGQSTTANAVGQSSTTLDQKGARSASSTTAVAPPKRLLVTKKSTHSNRSEKIQVACKSRDGESCRLCNGEIGLSAHILPFSLQGRKFLDFWAFVAMFQGTLDTADLKAAALDPDPNTTDNILNIIFLCHNCHVLLDKPMISLIPPILKSPSVFAYDPRIVTKYNPRIVTQYYPPILIKFLGRLRDAAIAILQVEGEFKRMRLRHVLMLQTADSANLPLPHPLLLQLHVVCSRMVVMRAAAGCSVLMDDNSDGDTVFNGVSVSEHSGNGMGNLV